MNKIWHLLVTSYFAKLLLYIFWIIHQEATTIRLIRRQRQILFATILKMGISFQIEDAS